jgi:UDP-glucose 4-epimerase
MRALVTGATGFIGRHLVQALLDSGWSVCCMVRRRIAPRVAAVDQVAGDLLHPEQWRIDRDKVGTIDAVFHCAALLPVEGRTGSDLVIVNGWATVKLLEACGALGIGRFVYLSSISVVGTPETTPIDERHPLHPATPYALGKAIGELACETARYQGMKVTVLRLTSPYGWGMAQHTVLPFFLRRATEGLPLTWHGSGTRAQDFIHVSDVVAACLRAVQTDQARLYCLGSGTATTMRALAEQIAATMPGVRAHGSDQADPQESVSWRVDISALRRDLGFQPRVALPEGIREMLAPSSQPDWLA